MNNESFTVKYVSITHLIQEEFDRNLNKYGDKIKCRKGCSQCCSQIFRITPADAFVIKDHFSKIPDSIRNAIQEKAMNYIKNLHQENSEDDFSREPSLSCPALSEEGECVIYEARPVICRRFGPPVFDYKKPHKLFACELNFKDGDEILDKELIPNQTLIGIEWDELKTEYNMKNNLEENASTTIAEAILKC